MGGVAVAGAGVGVAVAPAVAVGDGVPRGGTASRITGVRWVINPDKLRWVTVPGA